MEPNGAEHSARTDKVSLGLPTKFTPRRLVAIQALRGIAALMIVVHHVQDQSPGFKAIWPTQAWQSGVDLFFVISGFVMVYVTHDRERSAQQFLAMRAARIIPVYWFYTLAAALLMFLMPQLFRSNELTVRHIVLSLLFIPHQTGNDSISPIVKQGWTLNYEVFFYILFAIAIYVSARRRVSLAVGALLGIVLTGYWMQHSDLSLGTADFYFHNILLEFAFGMVIAWVFLHGGFDAMGPKTGILLAVSGFASLFLLDPFYTSSTRALVYGVPAAAIVVGMLVFEIRSRPLRFRVLQFAGDASYSIYLVHGFPIAALRALWTHGPLPMSGIVSFVLFLAVSSALAVAMGALSYYTVERTSLKFLRKRVLKWLK